MKNLTIKGSQFKIDLYALQNDEIFKLLRPYITGMNETEEKATVYINLSFLEFGQFLTSYNLSLKNIFSKKC